MVDSGKVERQSASAAGASGASAATSSCPTGGKTSTQDMGFTTTANSGNAEPLGSIQSIGLQGLLDRKNTGTTNSSRRLDCILSTCGFSWSGAHLLFSQKKMLSLRATPSK